jgi:PAS domain S-box-containing protein
VAYTGALLRRDGSEVTVEWLHSNLADDEGLRLGVLCIGRDVSDLENARAALRASEELNRGILATAVNAIITINERGIIETVNPAAERIFGWRESELLGRSALLLVSETVAARYRLFLARNRDDEGLIGTKREIDGFRRDGSVFPMEVAFSEMRLGGRRLFIATVRDLSDKRRADAELARLQEEVRRNEVMALIGSLVAGFAHEARNPLFGISAVLDALAARFGEGSEYAEHFSLLRRDVRRLNDLMQDLLEFGRPTANADLAPQPIGRMLADAVSECATLRESSGVDVELRGVDDEVRVAANVRLVRAFQNLLQNAIQFSPRGSAVTLAIARCEPDTISCVVRDRGPGLAAADLPRLFEPFYTRRRGGTGLGLAIVQRIVEEHRGTVAAANHPEGGAEITVRLPVVEP